jgi:hypothetical protein
VSESISRKEIGFELDDELGNESSIAVEFGTPLFTKSTSGAAKTMTEFGENPSPRFWSVTSSATPSTLIGVASLGIAKRRPVGVLKSGTVKRLSGHGNKQVNTPGCSHVG